MIISPEGGILSALVAALILCFWTFGGILAAALLMVELDHGNSGAFQMAWLTIWVFAEIYGVAYILWKLFGRIVIRVSPEAVTVSHKVFGIGSSQTMPAAQTSGMYWVPDDHSVTTRVNGRRIAKSALKIEASPRPMIVARGITRADGEAVIAACGPNMPRWGRAAA